jgi:hypothetical protein
MVQLTLNFHVIEARAANLIGDRAYGSDELGAEPREQRTEMIAPHRFNRARRKTHAGSTLRRYRRRWIVEWCFAWLQ